MTVKNYVLDINKTSLQHPSIVLRQDDYNIYTVNISVTENGVPVNLGSYTLNFLGITPAGAKIIDSKNFITTPADLAVGKFSYRFPKEAAGSKGVYDVAYFRLKTTSGATSTIDLNLRVLGGIDLTADEVKDYITVDDILLNTLTSEVFKKVDAKVDEHLATVKKGDKGDPGKDGVVDYSKTVNITGNQTVAGNKTFNGVSTFSNPIIGSLKTQHATFKDFNIIAKNMSVYAGNWFIYADDGILNGPYETTSRASYIKVEQVGWDDAGLITFADITNPKEYWHGIVSGGILSWHKVPKDGSVIHSFGNETITGDKTFTSNTTLATTSILAGNYGIRVTPSGFQKTTDGKTWVSANI